MQKLSLISNDDAMVQSYVNHIAHIIDQHFRKKAGKQQLEIIFRVCKNMLLKEEILPYYQNSWFFLNFGNFEHPVIRR